MNFLCERVGFFLKQGSSAHDIKIHYFFVDDDFGLFYSRNLAYLERFIRECDSIPELIDQLSRKNLKRLKFNNSKISSLKTFPILEYIPFPNRNCFELTVAGKKYKSILIFAIFDDNVPLLYDFLKNYSAYLKKLSKNSNPQEISVNIENSGFQTKKSTNFKKYSPAKTTASEKTQEIAEYSEKFQLFMNLAHENKIKKSIIKPILEEQKTPEIKEEKSPNLSEEIQVLTLENGDTYSGQVLNGLPHGQGTEFREDGLSYKGEFRHGKWHGTGYLVNSNLDLCFAEFINGEPVGF